MVVIGEGVEAVVVAGEVIVVVVITGVVVVRWGGVGRSSAVFRKNTTYPNF